MVVSCGRVAAVFCCSHGESGRKMANLTRNCSNMEKEIEEMDTSTVLETIPSFPKSSCTEKSGIESELIKVVPSPVDLTLTPPTATRGGFTCCVPHCFNNSKEDKMLSFYRIPKDKTLRKFWLHKISRKDFEPTDGHRVCSAHFMGGKKTYMNNIPLIVPKTVKPVQSKPRQTLASSGNRGRPLVEINMKTNDTEIENEQPLLGDIQEESHQYEKQIYRYEEEIASLKRKIHDMEVSHKRSIDVLQGEIKELKKKNFSQSFTIENAKETRDMLQFYTGLPDYETFEILFNYLGPAVKNLVYIGSNTVGSKIDSETYIKRGPKRAFSPKQELFIVLSRLRCALLEKDLAFRLGVSVANISRICATWIDFLHCRLRALPIWASRQTIDDTMPKCFKESYPSTRVIVDCTELFIEKPSSLRSQSITYSSYKHHNTAKGLIGIAPSAAITFVSDLFAGRVSDKKATKESSLHEWERSVRHC